MRRSIVSLLMICSCLSVASAQQQPSQPQPNASTPMVCVPTTKFVKGMKDSDQKLLFFGESNKGTLMLFQNVKESDWFVALVPKGHPEITCLVDDGEISDTVIPIDQSGLHA